MLESTATARGHPQPTPAVAGFFLSTILQVSTMGKRQHGCTVNTLHPIRLPPV